MTGESSRNLTIPPQSDFRSFMRDLTTNRSIPSEVSIKDASRGVVAPSYIRNLFRPKRLQEVVLGVADVLGRLNKISPIEAIAGSGVSGLPVLGAVSFLLGIPMVVVRKSPDESDHIIDDLIESGDTIRRIDHHVRGMSADSCCVGIILYAPIYGRNPLTTFQMHSTSEPIPVFELDDSLHYICTDSRLDNF